MYKRQALYLGHVIEIADNPDVLRVKISDFSANGLGEYTKPDRYRLRLESSADSPKRTHLLLKYKPVVSFLADKLAHIRSSHELLFSEQVDGALIDELRLAKEQYKAI